MSVWERAVAPPGSDLREVVSIIDRAGLQTALICDDDGRLIGIVTDGDIRRAFLNGMALSDSADEIVNRRPTVVSVSDGRQRAVMLMRQFGMNQIPVLDDEGRVVGLETMLSQSGDVGSVASVVIMAGGLGSRLAPLTDVLPKPLIDVGGKPILETIVERLALYRLTKIYMCVNYKAEMIEDHFGDGSAWNTHITYVHEEERRGTAGALSLLPEQPTGPIVVINGDVLTSIDFESLLDFHNRDSGKATMCVREHVVQVPYGVAATNGSRLVELSEKPEHKFFINAGIYVLDPEVLSRVPDGEFYDMTTLFEELMQDNPKPAVFPIREKWLDIGQFHDLERAQQEIGGFFDR